MKRLLSLFRAGRRGLLLPLLGLVALLGLSPAARATHIRAGDIQATSDPLDPYHFFFKMVLYTDASGSTSADTPTITIFFGDNTRTDNIQRRDKILLTGAASDSYLNTYYFEHTYNAASPLLLYKVAFIGENRKSDLVNIPNAANQTFYIFTSVAVDPAIAYNRSPVLNNPALNKGSRRQVFNHNPAAFDADGDSLVYELRPSQKADLQEAIANGNQPKPVDCAGFVYPNLAAGGTQVAYTGTPAGQPGSAPIFVQDRQTGTIIWNSPEALGDYNVAFVVREYRRTGARYRLIGEVVRDMQITVRNANNQPPVLTVPAELCVVAGVPVVKSITATDPDNDPVTLTAFGFGKLLSPTTAPATFTITPFSPPRVPATARGIFRWTPTCNDIAKQPYLVLFRAEDSPTGRNGTTPLADERPMRIRVVGPAPQNVSARLAGGTVVLNWDAYACQNPGATLLVYRKEGCTITPVDTCVTGIPAGSGFVKIGELPVGSRTFTDDFAGAGPERGKTYSYRLFVQFGLPAGGASLASREACVTATGKAALLKNVTVDRTSATNGQITVRWSPPSAGPGNAFNNPVGYNLFRSPVQATPAFTKVNANPIAFTDSAYVDQGLNTQDQAYIYRLDFFSNATALPGSAVITESTASASSVRLETKPDPAALKVTLTWTHNVPWDNSLRPVTIYRRTGTGSFVQLATAPTTKTGGTYEDKGTAASPLVIGGNYCYYVQTDGTYGKPDQRLLNLSQEQCVRLAQVPCTPVLKLKQTNCDSLQARLFDLPATSLNPTYTNYLSWTLGSVPANCSRNVKSYRLYYRPNVRAQGADTTGTSFTLLATLTGQSYAHVITNGSIGEAGCYRVVAVDSVGTTSAPSNVECKDNCPLFLMPNVFTPNNDGKNDKLRPKVASPIRRTKFQVFNRWGVQVYEGDADPLINWDGGGPNGEGSRGVKVVDGIYYYLAEVEFADLAGTKKTYKGWVELVR